LVSPESVRPEKRAASGCSGFADSTGRSTPAGRAQVVPGAVV
jgi:hypothetical protein